MEKKTRILALLLAALLLAALCGFNGAVAAMDQPVIARVTVEYR